MLFRQWTVLGFFALAGFSACKKEKPEDKFVFNNNTDSVIFIDIYASQENFYNNEHPIVSGYIAPDNKYELLSSPLEETIYVDWYSQQGKLSNWLNDQADESRPYTMVAHPKKNRNYDIDSPLAALPLRGMLLNGNKKETRWKVVDAVVKQGSSVQSVWAQATDDEKKTVITFRKDFTLVYVNPSTNDVYSFTSADMLTYKIIHIGSNWAVMGNGAEPGSKWVGATTLMNDTLAFVQTSDPMQRTFIFVKQP